MKTPRILIIAGSDSGGGAGIQADIKTVTMLGGHAMTAVTAVTAQNTIGLQAVHPVPTAMVVAQIRSVWSDIGVDAVKIGMLGSAETAAAVADLLGELTPETLPIVFDPVMVATSGAVLADDATIAAFARLMALATVTTPNLPEWAVIQHRLPTSSVRAAPVEALPLSPVPTAKKAASTSSAPAGRGMVVLLKGGHGEGDVLVDRLIVGGVEIERWESERIATSSTHGTGCTLASAIATYLAMGRPLATAIAQARQFVRLAIKDAPGFGAGHGPMGHQRVRLDLGPGARLNQVTLPQTDPLATQSFYQRLGLAQIVTTDDAHYARFEAAGGATMSLETGAVPTLFFECEDLDADVARLQAAGIAFDHLPVDQDWRWREARLRDPSGNHLCLYQAGENRRYPPWRLPGESGDA